LDKLKKKGFAYDKNKNPDHSYSSHKGVVGQSSHDIVYSLPENFYFDDMIKSPSHHPFSSPPTEAKWFTKKSEPKIMGRSQVVLSKKSNFEDKENKEKNGNIKTGKIKFVGKKSNDPSPTSNSPSSSSLTFLEKSLLRAESLRLSGKRELAVGLLMELIDEKEVLSKADLLKVHDHISSITNELGWLDEI